MKKCLLVLSGFVMAAGMLFAQPVNDNCSGAIPMNYAEMEMDVVLVTGDTRGGTGDLSVPNVCSGTWFQDDIWFALTMPDMLPEKGVIVRAYFGTEADDVLSAGMAIYGSCDADAVPFACFSTDDPNMNRMEVASACLEANGTYYVRVWSGGAATDFAGTFRIGAYAAVETDNVLWAEDFNDGLTGWMTFGTCDNADSNANAVWRYLPDGLLDQGAYIFEGFGISSPTLCNGAVGVDSDFDDNAGVQGNFGAGRCPAPGQYILVSPALAHAEWDVAGISIIWTQAIRQFQSTYFVGYRTYANGVWGDWRNFQVNQEFETNGPSITSNQQRVFMGGAQMGDSLQIRFVYNANYYMWGIDDVIIVEAPCVNLRSMPNWYAIAPAVNTPVSQVVPWWPMNDIYNAGACAQTNVNLNFTVTDQSGTEVYNENLAYGTIAPDSLAENVNFATPVIVSNTMPNIYTGTYTLTSDDSDEDNDFDFSDNITSFNFATTTDLYAYETGATRSVAVAQGIYDATAPLSYTYGNYFYFPQGSCATLNSVTWGVTNPADVAGIPINLILFKWVDANNDQIAQSVERQIIAFAQVEFSPGAPPDQVLETVLENFNNPGAPIFFEDDAAYLMMVEYNAVDRTFFFLQASEEYDYGGVVFSAAQAGERTYSSVLGFSPDGNVQGIDYEVTELGITGRVYFGWDIVPVVRLNVTIDPDCIVGVSHVLPADNTITLFPNPASEQIHLKMEFTQRMEHVQIIMIDAAGKSIFMQNYRDMEQALLEFDVTRLVSGAYTVRVATDKGMRAVPFIVQR